MEPIRGEWPTDPATPATLAAAVTMDGLPFFDLRSSRFSSIDWSGKFSAQDNIPDASSA